MLNHSWRSQLCCRNRLAFMFIKQILQFSSVKNSSRPPDTVGIAACPGGPPSGAASTRAASESDNKTSIIQLANFDGAPWKTDWPVQNSIRWKTAKKARPERRLVRPSLMCRNVRARGGAGSGGVGIGWKYHYTGSPPKAAQKTDRPKGRKIEGIWLWKIIKIGDGLWIM